MLIKFTLPNNPEFEKLYKNYKEAKRKLEFYLTCEDLTAEGISETELE